MVMKRPLVSPLGLWSAKSQESALTRQRRRYFWRFSIPVRCMAPEPKEMMNFRPMTWWIALAEPFNNYARCRLDQIGLLRPQVDHLDQAWWPSADRMVRLF